MKHASVATAMIRGNSKVTISAAHHIAEALIWALKGQILMIFMPVSAALYPATPVILRPPWISIPGQLVTRVKQEDHWQAVRPVTRKVTLVFVVTVLAVVPLVLTLTLKTGMTSVEIFEMQATAKLVENVTKSKSYVQHTRRYFNA
jgi:hypothetical protein